MWPDLRGLLVTGAVVGLLGCENGKPEMDMTELTELGTRYAAAWSSQDPALLASFYALEGSLKVNDGAPAIGREAIARTAGDFMTGFPDMELTFDGLEFQVALDRNLYRSWRNGQGGRSAWVRRVDAERVGRNCRVPRTL